MTEQMTIKPSERNQNYATGAVRGDNTGRGKPSLFPFDVFRAVSNSFGGAAFFPYAGFDEVCMVFEAGAKKYAARNWEKGIPLENYVDSASRHLGKFLRGWVDEPHAGQFAWNVVCLFQTHMWINDRRLPGDLNTLPFVNFDRRAVAPVAFPKILPAAVGTISSYADAAMEGLCQYVAGGDPLPCLQYATANALAVVDTFVRVREKEFPQTLNDCPFVQTLSD